MKVTGSIVLYNNDRDILLEAINKYLDNENFSVLYLIDNSSTDELKSIIEDERVEYIHNPSNPGFGAAHNIAIRKAIEINSDYHFVVNPDIIIMEDVVTPMLLYMENNDEVGMMMPKILNIDHTVQYLPKLLPAPQDILLRKLMRPKKFYDRFIDRYELRNVNESAIYQAPVLSGCFTLFRIASLKEVGLYDDGFFMYFEDWDISRRMNKKYKTIVFQQVSVIHEYESGANKSKRLFKIFIQSAIHYFNKWGWFFDQDRKTVNTETLQQFQ